jgi:hypothetical protein
MEGCLTDTVWSWRTATAPIVERSDDASRGTVVGQSREPSFRETLSVAYADDRYLVVNSKAQNGQSYTVVSVPAAG